MRLHRHKPKLVARLACRPAGEDSMNPRFFAAPFGLLLAAASSVATAQPLPTACPLPDTSGSKVPARKATGGGASPGAHFRIRTAEKGDSPLCPSDTVLVDGKCPVYVEAKSYQKNARSPVKCCVRVEFARLLIEQGKQPTVRWNIKAGDGYTYFFEPAGGITVIDPTEPGDLGRSDSDPLAGQWFDWQVLNKKKKDLRYEFRVRRQQSGAIAERSCDRNDPVIVNQGN